MLFCLYFNLEFIPASESSLCLFAQFLSRTFRSVKAIKACLTAWKSLHESTGVPIDNFQGCQLALTYRGLARSLAKAPTQALPLTPELLMGIYNTLDLTEPEELVFWSILLTGFFSLARVSNLIKTNVNDFHLRRSRVHIAGSVMLLVFLKTKTIQFGERSLQIPLVSIPGSPLCPVTAYQNMITAVPAPPSAAAFSYPCAGSLKPYTYSKFQKFLKAAVKKLGKNPRLYSSHSMRRGVPRRHIRPACR